MTLRAGVAFALILWASVPAGSQTIDIAFGTRHAVALRNNGDVLTWGDNVMCQLGRAGGNSSATPTLALRNGVAIAAASEHTLALTADGKVYGWGSNPEGALGLGNTFDQCDGPALVSSLADKAVTRIATGNGFGVAVTSAGDIYCSGDNSVGQCPGAKGGGSEVFIPVAIPDLAGRVVDVAAGAFHTLALTRDGRLYAFGRGREGQLGNARRVNGASFVAELTDVRSFAAGTWHSAAVRSDGSVWTWGSNLKSQLCDGATANRSTPVRVALPAAAQAARVSAGGHSTMFQAADGALFACGDNQYGLLGVGPQATVPLPAAVPITAPASALFAVGVVQTAISPDGCGVRLAGDNGTGIVGSTSRTFVPRANLTLCGARPATTLANLLREPPRGGGSGCWAPRKEEDAAADKRFTALRTAMLAAEDAVKRNAPFTAALEPVRMRTSISAGPGVESSARLHVKVVPERKIDGTRLWTGACDVIPQIDRIGGAISQISIFFNAAARDSLLSPAGVPPKLTGRVGGYPEYEGWVVITKDGRVPWVPQTLADKLDAEATRRRRALDDWNRSRASMKVIDEATLRKTYEMLKRSDPAGAEKFLTAGKAQIIELNRLQSQVYPLMTAGLEKQVRDLEQYRASFTREQLASPAVRGDPSGEGKRRLDAEIAALRKSLPVEQREWRITDAAAQYDLRNLVPGPADKAISVKADPAFPAGGSPDPIQIITLMFSMDPNPRNEARRAWQQQVKDSFDFAALAELLK